MHEYKQQRSTGKSLSVFISYAPEDEPLLKKLKAHLEPLQRERLIDIWYDRDIMPGSSWPEEIDTHLETASLILLLISPAFLLATIVGK